MATSHGAETTAPVLNATNRSRHVRAATTATATANSAPVGVSPATAMAVARHQGAAMIVVNATAGSNAMASTSDHWPCNSLSTTKGFHSSIVTAAIWPTTPTCSTRRTSSAAATPPTVSPQSMSNRMTRPASVNPPARASTVSCGAARAADSPNPHAASVSAGCGGTTMSRNIGIPGDANGHSTAATSRNVQPTTIIWPARSDFTTAVFTATSLSGEPDRQAGRREGGRRQASGHEKPRPPKTVGGAETLRWDHRAGARWPIKSGGGCGCPAEPGSGR